MKMKFLKFEDRGAGICAVFSTDPYTIYMYDGSGNAHPIVKHTAAFIRSSLEARATNMEASGIDASMERQVLSSWPT